MPPPARLAVLPVMVTLVSVTVSVQAAGQPLLPVLLYKPPPACPAIGLVPFVPAVLPLMTVPWSTSRFTEFQTPPPNPADLLPEIVLLWIMVCREFGVFVKVKMPPPMPLP